ncbi:unnamed protein product [Candidula unifasciata]|uniref:Uncharacterized protein n=1 Tax=Candidula unifasciata TaxID=100452 RepID=A0A8S3YRK3_9EUPU|nr:unnamed protein product [Candidula unifasciata]
MELQVSRELFLLVFCMYVTRGQIDSPCQLIHVQKSAMSDLAYLGIPRSNSSDLQIPSQCLSGSVNWHSPMGVMSLHLTRADRPYQLCLQGTWSTDLGGVSKVVKGVETVLPLPTRDSLSCTEDVDGKARLLVSATSYLLYMTEFAFRVVKLGSP